MGKKVYVVTSGDYSSYGIEQIFSIREKAEEYIKLVNEYDEYGVNAEIEEYELDPEIKIQESPHKFKYFYWITMDRDGNVLHARKSSLDIFHPENTKEDYYLRFEKRFNEKKHNFEYFYVLSANINANSGDHAIKILGEKRSKLLNEDRWPDISDPQKRTKTPPDYRISV